MNKLETHPFQPSSAGKAIVARCAICGKDALEHTDSYSYLQGVAAEREAIVRYLDAAAGLWQPVPRAALREASEAIRLGAHHAGTVSATIPHYATLQEAQGPEDAGMTKPETVAFLEGERQRLAEEVRDLRAGMFDLQLAVGGSSCLDAVRGATSAEREAIVRYLRSREISANRGSWSNSQQQAAQWVMLALADEIEQVKHHATLQEAQGPDSATPSASADSCAKKGGADSSPETSG